MPKVTDVRVEYLRKKSADKVNKNKLLFVLSMYKCFHVLEPIAWLRVRALHECLHCACVIGVIFNKCSV